VSNVKITIIKSGVIGGRTYLALDIEGTRHGPDAGPWTDVQTFSVPKDDLREAIAATNKSDHHG